jgi:thymidylate kinase
VADEYQRLAAAEPNRFTVIDGTEPPTRVHAAVMARIDQMLAGSARK